MTPPSKPNQAKPEDRIKCALCDSTEPFYGQKSWICPACSDWIQKMKAPRTEAEAGEAAQVQATLLDGMREPIGDDELYIAPGAVEKIMGEAGDEADLREARNACMRFMASSEGGDHPLYVSGFLAGLKSGREKGIREATSAEKMLAYEAEAVAEAVKAERERCAQVSRDSQCPDGSDIAYEILNSGSGE